MINDRVIRKIWKGLYVWILNFQNVDHAKFPLKNQVVIYKKLKKLWFSKEAVKVIFIYKISMFFNEIKLSNGSVHKISSSFFFFSFKYRPQFSKC